MSNVPEGAQLSDDQQWWWDGENWQPVGGNDPNAAAGNQPDAAGGNAGEASQEELQAVNDNGTDPGDESKLDDKLKPYFQPDYDSAPDDDSWAEVAEALDDSQYTNDNSNAAGGSDSDSNSNSNAEGGN